MVLQKKRKAGILIGLLSLCLSAAFSPKLAAQQASDLIVTTEKTDSKCGGVDGKVAIKVELKAGYSGNTIKERQFQLRNSKDKPMATSADYVLGNEFLVPVDTYTPYARVLFNNGVTVDVKGDPVVVTTTYVPATSVVTLERKSLKNYKPNSSSSNVPTGIVSLFVKDGIPPYTATIIESPSSYSGTKEFSLEAQKKKYLYGLPIGKYKIQIKDGCRAAQAVEINMEYVKSDLPKGGKWDFPYGHPHTDWNIRQYHCGWMGFWHTTKGVFHYEPDTQDIHPYLSNKDTMAIYYNYAFQTIKDFEEHKSRTYYPAGNPAPFSSSSSVGSENNMNRLLYKFPDNISYETAWLNKQYWPLVFLQVKGSSEEMQKGFNPYEYTQEKDRPQFPKMVSHYREQDGDKCSTKYYIRIRPEQDPLRLFCLPLKAVVKEKDSGIQVGTEFQFTYDKMDRSHESKFAKFPTSLDMTKSYTLTVTDPRGSKYETTLDASADKVFTLKAEYGDADYCEGKRKLDLVLYRYRPTGTRMSGHKITFISAPNGFVASPDALQLNTPYTVPEDYRGQRVFLFSKLGPEQDKPSFRHAPEGKYVVKVSVCDKEYTAEFEVKGNELKVAKYSENPQAFTPHLTTEECGFVRFYPFTGEGGTKFLLKDNQPIPSILYVSKFPDGIEKKDIRTNLMGNALGYWTGLGVISAENEQNPEKIYLDIPTTTANMEVRLLRTSEGIYQSDYIKTASLECLPTHEIKLANALLSYDREKYIGYICPSKTSGLVRIDPINYVGNVTVLLYKREEASLDDDNKALASVQLSISDLKSGKGAEFKLGKGNIPIDEAGYQIKIKDDACKNDARERIYVYLLPSPNVIQAKDQKRKYCEGETIELSIAALNTQGDDSYMWTLPDGSTRKGRKIRIENATVAMSGVFKVTVSGIMCDDVATEITIEYPISVAPKELWWREDAVDADWHNINNWARIQKQGGTETLVNVKAVPAPCTDVHIPAVVKVAFPDLGAKTDRTVYGQPECAKLYLHQGAQLGNPHHLTYTEAFVDYNFGIMDYFSGTANPYSPQAVPTSNSKMMARDQWYMIAAPLKGILSGDFGLAGYPKTHQRYLDVKAGGSTPTDASFKKPINSLVEHLSDHNNAMALRVGNYQAGVVGYNDHKHLNKLKGMVWLPFFDGKKAPFSDVTARPLHTFNESTYESTFRYYNEATLAHLNKTDVAKRSPLSYRFVFENDNDKRIGKVTIAGSPEDGYALTLKEGLEANDWFMVGNPFMTPISFDKLLEANKENIYPYYYIFNGKDKKWELYSKESGAASTLTEVIAPLQSVLLRKKSNAKEVLFPVGSKTVLLPSWRTENGGSPVDLRSASTEDAITSHPLSVQVQSTMGESSEAFLSWEIAESIPALSNSEYGATPVLFFVDPDTKEANKVEAPTKAHGRLALGIESSLASELELTFDHIDRAEYEELVLVDKLENMEQDLLNNSTYRFVHQPNDGSAARFVLKLKRFGVENEPTSDELAQPSKLVVRRAGDRIQLESNVGVRSINAYDMQGRLCGEWTLAGEDEHRIDIALDGPQNGLLVVDIRLKDGSRIVRKI
ncbi:MAG: hypothetical protein SPI72_04070 [Porphyromonas sp.]|nr:hypothetical protein [Porphyromonas sp.]